MVHAGPPSHTHFPAHRDKAEQPVQAATCTSLVHVRTVCVGVFSCGLFFVIYSVWEEPIHSGTLYKMYHELLEIQI
jgi:hypothetical protein